MFYIQTYKPGSVSSKEVSIIYLVFSLLKRSNDLPWNQTRREISLPIFGLAPHRVYLVSLQHYLYILSVALFLASRLVAVNHYSTLRCPDFPLFVKNEQR